MTASDQIKGKVKQAAGDLTGDNDLKREGKVDEASGTIKDKVADVADAVKDRLHRQAFPAFRRRWDQQRRAGEIELGGRSWCVRDAWAMSYPVVVLAPNASMAAVSRCLSRRSIWS